MQRRVQSDNRYKHSDSSGLDNETLISLFSVFLVTLLLFLLALLFYLIRSRLSKSTKHEECRSVLGASGIQLYYSGSSPDTTLTFPGIPSRVVSDEVIPPVAPVPAKPVLFEESSFKQLPPQKQQQQPSCAVRPTPRRSVKDRRPSSIASKDSLTISIHSSASFASSGQVPNLAGKCELPGICQRREQEILRNKSRPLTIEALKATVTNLAQLSAEFMDLPMNHPEKVDVSGVNKAKNRHPCILPNSHSRVRLSGPRYEHLGGYINANYIRGYKGGRVYIAAQGPLPETVDDFWWMVWQEGISAIVMLTRLKERNNVMCENYWPVGTGTYGDITVTCEFQSRDSGYHVNGFLVTEAESATSRKVRQYCYLYWPDNDVPDVDDARGLISIMQQVNKQRQWPETAPSGVGPVLVHCSAGIGRTGCFIALHSAMDQFNAEGIADVLRTVAAIRLDRGGLVQTLEQYQFIHRVLLQSVQGEFTVSE